MSHRRIWIACLVVLLLALVPVATYAQDDQVRLFLPQMASSASSQEDGPLEEVTDPSEGEVTVAWHGSIEEKETCTGWEVKVNTWWDGKKGYITYQKNLEGEWSDGQTKEYWKVVVTWYKYGDHGPVVDTWTKDGWVHKPNNCPPPADYKLNWSHAECVTSGEHIGKVEVHFVLLNVADNVTPGKLYYPYGTIEPGAHTGNVWHYTAYLPAGQITIDWAYVYVNGTKVWLKNKNEYNGKYNCTQKCEQTKTIKGEWSEWKTDPTDPSKQYRTREVKKVDVNDNSIVCDKKTEKETRKTPCYETKAIYDDWSEWEVDPNDPSKEFRTRKVDYEDVNYPGTICNSKEEREERPVEKPPVCEQTTPKYSEWSDWMVDPQDSSKEFRTRTVDHVDIYDESVVCKTETEREERPVDKPQVCEQTTEVIGDWSEWTVDPNDPTKEFRTRQVDLVDVNDNSVVCDTSTETETRDVPSTPVCEETMLIEGNWSDWMDHPENPELQIRKRTNQLVDVNDNSVICDTEEETQTRLKPKIYIPIVVSPACEETMPQEGEWSEWQVDMTEALEFRTREIRFVDATNPDILCDVKVEREERQVSQRFVHASQDPHCNVGILAEGEEPRFIPFSEDESFDCAWPASEDAQTALKFALGKITYELSEYPGGGSIITEVKWVPVEGEEQVLTPREDKYLLGPVTIFVRHGDCSKKDCQDTLTFWPEHLQANGMLQEFFVAASSANAVVTK